MNQVISCYPISLEMGLRYIFSASHVPHCPDVLLLSLAVIFSIQTGAKQALARQTGPNTSKLA